MKFGSLFAGCGGFDLGLEWAGMECVWQVEIDDFCNRVLEKHWPHVKRYRDVREVGKRNLDPVDLICGGFPCQDISEAGRRVGIDGERSGLWWEMLRVVREMRPCWVLAENVPALKCRGYDRVRASLVEIGYAVRPFVVGAIHVGASQLRKRVWIVANANGAGFEGGIWQGKSNAPRKERETPRYEPLRSTCGYWPPGPNQVIHIPRMADGPSNRAHRLRAIGNHIVPQIPEMFGRAIMEVQNALQGV